MRPKKTGQKDSYWMVGKHACFAALSNPNRHIHEIIVTKNIAQEYKEQLPASHRIVDKKTIEQKTSSDAVHQGIAIHVQSLINNTLESYIPEDPSQSSIIVILDQITDPHNVGAILRSSAAFDVDAIGCMKHSAPTETASLAKTASGTLETVPLATINNLRQTIEAFKKADYWVIGLDGSTNTSINDVAKNNYQRVVLIMGAEGTGLRRLTKEDCDIIAKIPMSDKVESLNVSNAAAIALYTMNGI